MGECGRVLGSVEVGGEIVVIREACEADKGALVRFYESLSVETIYTRFFSIIRYFQPYVDKLLSRTRNVVVVAEASDGRIIGVAEAVADDGDAESGIAVLEAYQGRGVGKALAAALLRLAGERGIRRLYGYVMAGNAAAYRLATRFGARVARHYGDMILMEIQVPAQAEPAAPGEGCGGGGTLTIPPRRPTAASARPATASARPIVVE